jgi:hypothetical protein
MVDMSAVLDKIEFEKRFGDLYRSLYRGVEPRRSSFQNQNWSFLLTTRNFLRDKQKFHALRQAASVVQEDEMIITEVQASPFHRWSVVIPYDYDSYSIALGSRESGALLGTNKAILGKLRTFAAIVDEGRQFILGYTIFGGENEFIDSWVEALGGVDRIREEFKKSLELPSSWSGLQMDEDLKAGLLSDVGW